MTETGMCYLLLLATTYLPIGKYIASACQVLASTRKYFVVEASSNKY